VANWASALGLSLALTPAEDAARHGLHVDWDARRISIDCTPVRLAPMEWKALERLAAAPGELVSHIDLFRHLYGEDEPYRAQSTAIRVLITKLRRLLPPLRIEA
jgi:DNA-binding response OmpR family regulator